MWTCGVILGLYPPLVTASKVVSSASPISDISACYFLPSVWIFHVIRSKWVQTSYAETLMWIFRPYISLYVLMQKRICHLIAPFLIRHLFAFCYMIKKKKKVIKMLKHISCTHKNKVSTLANVTHTIYLLWEHSVTHIWGVSFSLEWFFFFPDILLIKYTTWHYDEETDTNRCTEL